MPKHSAIAHISHQHHPSMCCVAYTYDLLHNSRVFVDTIHHLPACSCESHILTACCDFAKQHVYLCVWRMCCYSPLPSAHPCHVCTHFNIIVCFCYDKCLVHSLCDTLHVFSTFTCMLYWNVCVCIFFEVFYAFCVFLCIFYDFYDFACFLWTFVRICYCLSHVYVFCAFMRFLPQISRKVRGRCVEGAWKVRGRCVEPSKPFKIVKFSQNT